LVFHNFLLFGGALPVVLYHCKKQFQTIQYTMANTDFTPRKVRIIPPETLTGLTIHEPKDRAAGLKAVTVALEHVAEEMGLINGLKVLAKINQRDGFDCPGCAWPEPDHRSKLGEYCENGAKAVAEEATNKRCDPEFFARHSVEEISEWSDYVIGKSGRVTHPMYLAPGSSHYQPIEWNKAFELIATELKACNSPDEAVFYTSGRTSNEAAFMYQLMVRKFGTNNLPDCSNMCHESSGVGLNETIGIGKGTVTLQDIYDADVVLVIGQNPGTNHPRMLSALTKCKKNGGKVIHINPMPEAGTTRFIDPQSPVEVLMGGTKLADHFLQVRIGGDIALLKLIMQRMFQCEKEKPGSVIHQSFIKDNTVDFESFKKGISELDVDQALKDCGVPLEQIHAVADLLCSTNKFISCWAMGLTQQKHAVNNIKEVVNLHLMRGAVGIKGAGLCPVRGHSNVQGDRTMGIYEKPKEAFLASLDRYYNMKSPREHGYDTVEAIEAMNENKVRVFIGLGGNFISATPDSEFTGKAMQKVKLSVHVSTKLNRAHVVTGEHALILPCLGRIEIDTQKSGEQFVTVENSMGIVSMSRGNMKPGSEHLRSEPAIVGGIAKALFFGWDTIDWQSMIDNYDVIRENIQGVIPGFDDYNKRVRQPDGFYLPNGPRIGQFTTPDQKAHFTAIPLPQVSIQEGRLIMMTIRTHDQYNTTIYGLEDRYRGIGNERRVILMNEKDMVKQGVVKGELVDLISHFNGVERVANTFHVVPYDIAVGCTATYFPETNCLVPIDHFADKSKTPVSKFIEISIRKKA
jgi:molybdopterin-dependent oxidoreductase alpha subunit